MKTIIRVALLAIGLLAGVASSEYIEGRKALSDARPQSCETIMETSRFYGTCCSLSTSSGGGCVVNIKNGWCEIKGQYWAKTWNSTDDRIECDPSEHTVEYSIDWSRMDPNANAGNGGSSAAGFPLVDGLMVLSAAVSAFLF